MVASTRPPPPVGRTRTLSAHVAEVPRGLELWRTYSGGEVRGALPKYLVIAGGRKLKQGSIGRAGIVEWSPLHVLSQYLRPKDTNLPWFRVSFFCKSSLFSRLSL